MPTTEPTVPAVPGINSIIANMSSNEPKILALERRLAGVDPGKTTGSGSVLVGSFSQLPVDPSPLPQQASTLGTTVEVAASHQTYPPDAPSTGPSGSSRMPLTRRTDNVAAVTAVVATAAAGDPSNKRRRIGSSPEGANPAHPSPSNSGPPLSDVTPVGVPPCTRPVAMDPAAAAATAAAGYHLAHVAAPLPQPSPATGGLLELASQTGAPPLAPPSGEPLPAMTPPPQAAAMVPPPSAVLSDAAAAASHPSSAALLQPQQQGVAVATAADAIAAGGVPPSESGGGGVSARKTRARSRKQQEPRHEQIITTATTTTTVPAGQRAATALTTTPRGCTAVAAGGQGPGGASRAGPVSTPRRTRGLAGPQQNRTGGGGGGGALVNPHATPPDLARRQLDHDVGTVAAAAAAAAGPGGDAGGRSSSSSGLGGNDRGTVAAAVPPPAAAAPPSAQKRSIVSYYPPVVGASSGGGGSRGVGGAALPLPSLPFVLDQNSCDSLPPSLHDRQQRADAAVAAAGGGGAPVDGPMDGGGAAAGGLPSSSSMAALQLQLRQSQEQVAQLQAQVIHVQTAMAAQQETAVGEIERLKWELQARCLEASSLADKARVAEAAVRQAVAGEAAARAGLEALQASSASDAARWVAEAAEAARVASEREARYRGELTRLLQSFARIERELSRHQLSGNSARLGGLTLVRTGPMQMAEVWEDGTAFQQLNARMAVLAAAKEELLAAQKLLRKRLAPPPSGARAGTAAAAAAARGGGGEASSGVIQDLPYMSGLEFVAADEVYKTRLSVLKREEEILREEEERLSKEKLKQIRSVKLAREEDGSRFGRWPVLPDRPEGHPRYVLMNLLGKGGFSEVFKAYDLVEARPVCVKIHALAPGWSSAKKESYVRHAIREYDIHRSLRHPAVVALWDVLEIDLDTFATVLELCEGGDLDGLMREHRTLPEREARCLMAQIFSGLRYLAARRIIHYDLKPANILFDSLGQAKITDFGLSKQVSEGQTLAGIELTSQGAGTYWYLPPEAFETGGPVPPRISNKLDVWSAGIIFYSILYGKKPYGEAMSQEQMLRERVMAVPRDVDFPSRPAVSSEAKDFIRRCLAWNQDNRLDVEAAATDPYITGCTTTAAPAGLDTAGGATGGPSAAAAAGGTLSAGLAGLVGGGRR